MATKQKEIEITLTKTHTHKGERYQADDKITVSSVAAQWLYDNEVALPPITKTAATEETH